MSFAHIKAPIDGGKSAADGRQMMITLLLGLLASAVIAWRRRRQAMTKG